MEVMDLKEERQGQAQFGFLQVASSTRALPAEPAAPKLTDCYNAEEPAAPDRAESFTAEDEASATDCLVRQLEDSDDEEDDLLGSDDAGGPNAHVAAAWKDLQYTSFLCGTYHFVKEKRKAEGFLQREFARAEAELGEDGQDDGPRKRPTLEGDIEYYSVEKQITRRQNKKSPGFLSAVRIIWDATRAEMVSTSGEPSMPASPTAIPGATYANDASGDAADTAAAATATAENKKPEQKEEEENIARVPEGKGEGEGEEEEEGARASGDKGGIDQAAFVCLMVKVHYLVICPPVDRAIAQSNACKDWAKDNAGGGSIMSYERFLASIFELVDLWTQTTEATEYDALAMMIANGITTEVERVNTTPVDASREGEGGGGGEGEREGEREGEGAAAGGAGAGRGEGPLGASLTVTAAEVGSGRSPVKRSFRFRSDNSIVYDPNITKEPVYMEDLVEKDDEDDGDGGGGSAGGGGEGDDGADADEKGSSNRDRAGKTGGKRSRRGLYMSYSRFGAVGGWKKSPPKWSRRSHAEEDGETYAAVSNLTKASGAARIALLSPERVNAIIAKIYFSKKQVDQKLLMRDGSLSWVDRCRRKKDQRMDRFILQYHIRQFGTKKLARRNLQQLCKSITRLAKANPRISAFAELIGVPVMVQMRPYAEQMVEFRPFACSDFVIPLLTKLCPPEEKMDRWLGNAKVPVAVTVNDFMQAVKEICPDVPPDCPAFVAFLIKVGRLSERLNARCRQEKLNKPHAGRPSIDLDEGLVTAMPVWSAEEEYLIMKVTLNSIAVLRRWMRRFRRRKEAGYAPPPPNQHHHQRHARVKTARKSHRSHQQHQPGTTTAATSKRDAHGKAGQTTPAQAAEEGVGPAVTAPDSVATGGHEVDEQTADSARQLRESASSPAEIPSASAAAAPVADVEATETRGRVSAEDTGETGEKAQKIHDSPRARQRLEQAKALDKEVGASQIGG